MSHPSIFCLATSRGRADRIIHDLKGAEFSGTAIGALFFDRHAGSDHAGQHDPRALTGAAAQSAGPIRGGLAGIAGIARLVVPGVGSCVAAGPIIAAMHQAPDGPPGAAIARGLLHLGIPALEAAHYAQRIKADGHILISVHPTDLPQLLRARDIFAAAHAGDICTIADGSMSPAIPAA